MSKVEFSAQSGPQSDFLASSCDITIYGGAAGGGKSRAILYDPIRFITTQPHFTAIMFRRTSKLLRMAGGLWEESKMIYPYFGGVHRENSLDWKFPVKDSQFPNLLQLSYLDSDADAENYKGGQFTRIYFDEGSSFEPRWFWMLVSRNRSACAGVKHCVKVGTNPAPDSWLSSLLDTGGYLDSEGFVRDEMRGKPRLLLRKSDSDIYWYDTMEELLAVHKDWLDSVIENLATPDYRPAYSSLVKSFTMIPSLVTDNPALLKAKPEYIADLIALPEDQRRMLLSGNWKVSQKRGKVIDRNKIQLMLPADIDALRFDSVLRLWDMAATEKQIGKHDPDYTVGTLMGKSNGKFYIIDVVDCQLGVHERDELMMRYTMEDAKIYGDSYQMLWEKQPSQAGVDFDDKMRKMFDFVRSSPYAKGRVSKVLHAEPFGKAVEDGKVFCKNAHWTGRFLAWLNKFPDASHDDHVDATAGAFNVLSGIKRGHFKAGYL